MKKLIIILIAQTIILNAYRVADGYFGLWGINKGVAHFSVESWADFKDCSIKVNIHKINQLKYEKDCIFHKDRSGKILACSIDFERCTVKSHIKKLIIQTLNNSKIGIWYVYGVRSDDTLSVRENAGVKYKKIYDLHYKAKNIKVISVKINKRSTWYKIKYKNIIGWVNSRYLNFKEKDR